MVRAARARTKSFERAPRQSAGCRLAGAEARTQAFASNRTVCGCRSIPPLALRYEKKISDKVCSL